MKIASVHSRALACAIAISGALGFGTQAQIVTYSFATDNQATLGFGVTGVTSVAGGDFVTASGLSPASGSPNISGGAATAGGWKLNGAENSAAAIADNNYFSFSVSRGSGDTWSLGDLSFNALGSAGSGSSAGPDSVAVFVSTTSSSTGFNQLGATLTGVKGTTPVSYLQPLSDVNVNVNDFTSLFFRIVAFTGAGNSGTLSIDSLTVGGTASPLTPVPEPEHYAAFAGLALVGFGAWRRIAGRKA